jgi:hypothetical protein
VKIMTLFFIALLYCRVRAQIYSSFNCCGVRAPLSGLCSKLANLLVYPCQPAATLQARYTPCTYKLLKVATDG